MWEDNANDWELTCREGHRGGLLPTDLSAFAHSAIKTALLEFRRVVVLVDHVDEQLHGSLKVTALVRSISPQLGHTAVRKCAQENSSGNCKPPGIRCLIIS